MNRLFKSILAVATCVAAFASCSKEPGNSGEQEGPKPSESTIDIKYDGKVYKASCCICTPEPYYDGITFYLVDESLSVLLQLQFASSLIGNTIDLTKLDPYASDDNYSHFNFGIYSDLFEGIELRGGEDILADSGSLKVEILSESKYMIDLEYTIGDHSVALHSEVDIVVPTPAKQSVLKYDGNNVDVAAVEFNRNLGSDGVYFYVYDTEEHTLLDIEFAFSLLGKEIDLTKLDVYADSANDHYNFLIESNIFEEIDLWGGYNETSLADSGSLILNYLGLDRFSIKLNYKLGEHTVDFVYEGSAVIELW